MAEAIPYAAFALFAIGAWVGGVVLLDVFTPPTLAPGDGCHICGDSQRAVRHSSEWRRRAPMLKRLQTELDLERLLGQANSDDTAAVSSRRTGAISLMTFALLLAADSRWQGGGGRLAGSALGCSR